MKTFFLACIIILLIIFSGCNREEKKEVQKNIKKVFSSAVENKIIDFINYSNNLENQPNKGHNKGFSKNVYTIYLYTENDTCYMRFISDYLYYKNNMIGYTFLNKQLVVINNVAFSDKCNYGFIDKANLLNFEDSIPGYYNETNFNLGIEYSILKRDFKIIHKDSIEIINTSYF